MDRYRVQPGQTVDLSSWDPNDQSEFVGGKAAGRDYLKQLRRRLAELQHLLWAEDRHKILVVLQAMDTGGKDGTIRNVLSGVNPQGIDVVNFKAPTAEELSHDYLWRVHEHTPAAGSLTVFNRSHYEDVLIVRVLGLVPEARWSRRYDHINDFERLLADEGTTILKFYLHISHDEQAERLQARLDDATKQWKFNKRDLEPDTPAALAGVQRAMLAEAWRLTRPGGRIVYSVCTVFAAETTQVVAGYPAEPPGELPGNPWGSGLLLAPHLTGTDGMFISLIERGG